MLKIIGLTGSIGSGKTTTSNMLRSKGYSIFDADSNVHDLMKNNTQVINKIIELFGSEVESNRVIDRQKLGLIVLSSKDKLIQLENILYPHIINSIEYFIKENQKQDLCFLDIPLLFEKKFDKFCHDVLVISVDSKIQEQRVLSRPHMTKDKFQKFINNQMSIKDKEKLAKYVIHNNDTLQSLEKNLDDFLLKIK